MENKITENLNSKDELLLNNYDFNLPENLIAQRSMEKRDQSRLFFFDAISKEKEHLKFDQIIDLIPSNSCLVFNNSKVFPCRLIGEKFQTKGKAELFFLSINSISNTKNEYKVLIKARGTKKIGNAFVCFNQIFKIVNINDDGTFIVDSVLSSTDLKDFLDQNALVPIPPYIRNGQSDEADKKSYQTVYASLVGSVAAPTAGLHFTKELLQKLKERKISIAFVTLHVGLGTFSPINVENLNDHKMHEEEFFIDEENLAILRKNKANLIAVGTTTLRALESVKSDIFNINEKRSIIGKTDIFIYPGINVESISGIITNFHLPKSSLLILISALIGRDQVLKIYEEAIKEKYRFFSYGDAMYLKNIRQNNNE